MALTRAVSLHSIKLEVKREHRPCWLRQQRYTSARPPSNLQAFIGTSTYSEPGSLRRSTAIALEPAVHGGAQFDNGLSWPLTVQQFGPRAPGASPGQHCRNSHSRSRAWVGGTFHVKHRVPEEGTVGTLSPARAAILVESRLASRSTRQRRRLTAGRRRGLPGDGVGTSQTFRQATAAPHLAAGWP